MGGMPPAGAEGPEQVIRWIYELKGVVLEFTIAASDGIILQVRAIGNKWPNARTSKGITLGSLYKEVLRRHGFPESHLDAGGVLVLDYQERQHVAFALRQDRPGEGPYKVFAITVALVQ